MLTKSGVKLLDFGLAKVAASPVQPSEPDVPADGACQGPDAGRDDPRNAVQYMAPEQLEGKEADPRTDIFAFGAVLYEMATGQEGVLREEPGLADLGDPVERASADPDDRSR